MIMMPSSSLKSISPLAITLELKPSLKSTTWSNAIHHVDTWLPIARSGKADMRRHCPYLATRIQTISSYHPARRGENCNIQTGASSRDTKLEKRMESLIGSRRVRSGTERTSQTLSMRLECVSSEAYASPNKMLSIGQRSVTRMLCG